jgi:isopentenyl diphosphate isomerase/L-lactate dehydrogenase-like FMN-dependent dehydrogenase
VASTPKTISAIALRLRIWRRVGPTRVIRRQVSVATVISDWVNVADAEREGLEKLERGPRDYFAGGAGDEVTLRENVAAWGNWRLRPRVLNDVREVSTKAELLGRPVEMPVLVAPVAYQRMAHPEGERAMAAGAAAAGTAMCLSTLSTTRPADVATAAPDGRRWFQLYAFKDAGVTRALMEEAIAAGFEAVVVTADAPPGGNRERDRRNRFTLPQHLGTPSLSAAVGGDKALSIEETFALMNHALTWADVEDLASECSVPVLVKGVLTAEDAELAFEHGAAGLVVSNHGGRQLDRSLATADALPEIAEAVEGRAALLVDGGIRRGVDVATALALGADAVLVGRPALWGLAAAGADGVAQVLDLLREELELTLALCGCTAPSQLTRAHARRAPSASVYSV